MTVLDRLFAFNGHVVTGARPTMGQMRGTEGGARHSYDYAVRQIVCVLDLLDLCLIKIKKGDDAP